VRWVFFFFSFWGYFDDASRQVRETPDQPKTLADLRPPTAANFSAASILPVPRPGKENYREHGIRIFPGTNSGGLEDGDFFFAKNFGHIQGKDCASGRASRWCAPGVRERLSCKKKERTGLSVFVSLCFVFCRGNFHETNGTCSPSVSPALIRAGLHRINHPVSIRSTPFKFSKKKKKKKKKKKNKKHPH